MTEMPEPVRVLMVTEKLSHEIRSLWRGFNAPWASEKARRRMHARTIRLCRRFIRRIKVIYSAPSGVSWFIFDDLGWCIAIDPECRAITPQVTPALRFIER